MPDTVGSALFFLFGMGLFLFLFLVWTVCIFFIRPQYFYRIWIGLPLLGLVFLICLVAGIPFYRSLPSVVFRDSLGFDPPPDITFVNSLRHNPIDWEDAYLEFYTGDATINRILQDGFAPIPTTDIIEDTYYPPYWWNPPTGQSIRIYATHTDDPEFRNKDFRVFLSHKLLIYDSESGTSGKRKIYLRYRRP